MLFTSLVAATLLSAAQAIDVQVVYVGWNPANNATGSQFWPSSLKAEPGSMVQFQFWTGNHTVTQSSFDKPCTPLEATPGAGNSSAPTPGINSGYQPVDESMPDGQLPTYTVWVNDTKPLWFYCAQGTHCQAGMAMVINADETSEKTLDAYKEAAAALSPGDGADYGGGSGDDSGSGEDSGDGSGSGSGSGDDSGSGEGSGSEDEVPGGDADAGQIGDDPTPEAAAPGLAIPSTVMLLVCAAMALF